MRHIVTLSLVFFSLTHLAKAERVDGLRLVTEKYCNKQQTNIELISVRSDHPDDQEHPFFLSYGQLASIGLRSAEIRITRSRPGNQEIKDLTVREKPKNNSP